MSNQTKAAERQPTLLDVDPEPSTQPTKGKKKNAAPPRPTAMVPATRQPTPAPTPAPVNMLAVIAQAAADSRVDVAKMQALLAMQKELRDEEARMAFFRDYLAMQQHMPEINARGRIEVRKKDASGERTGALQQSTPYARFNDIVRAVRPVLKQYGFALSFATEPSADGSRLIVKGFLDHRDGHQRSTAFPVPAETSGSKNNVQGWGSSMSYGKRYCTIALLNIVSEAMPDRDDDGATAGRADDDAPTETTLSPDDVAAMREKIKACGIGEVRFCEHYKIKRVEDLPAGKYEAASDACFAYGKKTREADHGKASR